MSTKTHIQWSGRIDEKTGEFLAGGTLNIAAGCSMANTDCSRCYAMQATYRLNEQRKAFGDTRYDGLTRMTSDGVKWTGKVVPLPDRVEQFIRKKGQVWFACSLTDLFHEDLPYEYLDYVWGGFNVAASKGHMIYALTKRPEIMADYLSTRKDKIMAEAKEWEKRIPGVKATNVWPLSNVWTGCSVGHQEALEKFYPELIKVPSVVKWFSIEPLVSRIDLKAVVAPGTINWAVIGGESGPKARIMEPEWVDKVLSDCKDLGITPFFKQKGEVLARKMACTDKKGGNFDEFPEKWQIREWPSVVAA